jgi:DNA-binding MarR family transcriptional regulator
VPNPLGTPTSEGAQPHRAIEPELPEPLSVWHAFLLRKAAQRITELAEARIGDLTLRHFGVLSLVGAEPGQNQRAVGESLRIDRTTIVAVTDSLERDNLLERRRGQDRRTFELHLTAQGLERLQLLQALVGHAHEEFLRPLSPEEQTMLSSLLLRLTQA